MSSNTIKLLKAQYLLGLTLLDERQEIGIKRYVDALEKRVAELEGELEEAKKKEADSDSQ